MTTPQGLLSRWRAVWPAVAATDGEAIFNDLQARYSEPHRAYHNLEHIRECLDQFDTARHLAARPVEIELAIWFHDAIYDSWRDDNEERSALLAAETLEAAGVDPATVERVAQLIRLTTHSAEQLNDDAALLCDIDLAILGAPPERFARYDADIRHEYQWVPEEVYRRERARVLARFLGRERIYITPFFFDRLERQARTNLSERLSTR